MVLDDIKVGDYFVFTGSESKVNCDDIGLLQMVISSDGYSIKSVFMDSKIGNYFEVGTPYYKNCVVEHIVNDEELYVYNNGVPMVWAD
jgi:hypothetical protein